MSVNDKFTETYDKIRVEQTQLRKVYVFKLGIKHDGFFMRKDDDDEAAADWHDLFDPALDEEGAEMLEVTRGQGKGM